MNATEIAAALSARAEDVCHRYLPRSRKEGRYWTAGDTSGRKGRSFFVRPGEPGIPAKWTPPRPVSMASCTISSVCTPVKHRCGAPWRRPAPSSPCRLPPPPMVGITPTVMIAIKRRATSGGAAGPSMALMRKPTCTPAPSAIAGSRRYGFILISSIAATNGIHRLPALVAAVTGDDGAIEGIQRTWLDPKPPAKADLVRPPKALRPVHGRAVRFGGSASGATLLAGEGIETVLSLVTVVPGILAAAALSEGSLGAFEPPQDLALSVIARDKDMEGEHAANRLQHHRAERGIPSIVIVPDRSDFNDDLIAFGEATLAARIAPLIASTKSAATVEERRGSGRIIIPS